MTAGLAVVDGGLESGFSRALADRVDLCRGRFSLHHHQHLASPLDGSTIRLEPFRRDRQRQTTSRGQSLCPGCQRKHASRSAFSGGHFHSAIAGVGTSSSRSLSSRLLPLHTRCDRAWPATWSSGRCAAARSAAPRRDCERPSTCGRQRCSIEDLAMGGRDVVHIRRGKLKAGAKGCWLASRRFLNRGSTTEEMRFSTIEAEQYRIPTPVRCTWPADSDRLLCAASVFRCQFDHRRQEGVTSRTVQARPAAARRAQPSPSVVSSLP